ncbi:hypothetical protein M9Y10_042126 [Tritrichomonas musculus]|uniref:CUE domain-containing protein n=1 Tax=Tritrichomonas musculus TaxID=1915356 RepID=A0ABR2K6E6_9EUKA
MTVNQHADNDIDHINILTEAYPSINYDDLTKLYNYFSYDHQKAFFTKFLQERENKCQESKAEIEIKSNRSNLNIIFNIKEASFRNNNESCSLGSTIEEIIEKNKKNYILGDVDKIFYSYQIVKLMNKYYKEDEDIHDDKFVHGSLSDQTFFVDSFKNIHLLNEKKNDRSLLFIKQKLKNTKKGDIFSCGCIIEELFTEKKIEDSLRTNQNLSWFQNNRREYELIMLKFPSKDDKDEKNANNTYQDFNCIVNDITENQLYKKNSEVIKKRIMCSKNLNLNPETFQTLILGQLNGVCDINSICTPLFTQLRDMAEQLSQYYLFFNLILHIFFPTQNITKRRIDYIEILKLFNSDKELFNIISMDLLGKYLPTDSHFMNSLNTIKELCSNEIKQFYVINNQYGGLISMIKDELSNKTKKIDKYLQIFFEKSISATKKEVSKNESEESGDSIKEKSNANSDIIFDYFGIIDFITYNDDLFYITNPSIRKDNYVKLNQMVSDSVLQKFFSKNITNNSQDPTIPFIESIDGFQHTNITHKPAFRFKDCTFWYERLFEYKEAIIDDNDSTSTKDFRSYVEFQNEVFTDIKSKHIINLDATQNAIKNTENNSSMVIPFFPATLNAVIHNSCKDGDKCFNDIDKVLWIYQIADAFKDLSSYLANLDDSQIDFKNSIFDQSFYIDSMKNIYLCMLAYDIKVEPTKSTSEGPMYFRLDSNPSYFYTFGVLMFEIFTEMEVKNIFKNMPRQKRQEVLSKGYSNFDSFQEYLQECRKKYDDDKLFEIINRCLINNPNHEESFKNFEEVINEIKNLKLYKKYQNIIEKREKNAKVINSQYCFTFHDLMTSAVLNLLDLKKILDCLLTKIKDNYCTEKIANKIEKSIQLLQKLHPLKCYFDALNFLPFDKFHGNISDLLASLIANMYYRNHGRKTIVIKESEIQNLGQSINDNLFLKNCPIFTRKKNFIPTDYVEYSQKVPLVSFEYYLEHCTGSVTSQYEWIYQIIYFIIEKGYYLTTDSKSYRLKVNDFALFYNNKKQQFDIDFTLKAIDQIAEYNGSLYVYSLGGLFNDIFNLKNKNFQIIFNPKLEPYDYMSCLTIVNIYSLGSLINAFIINNDFEFNYDSDAIGSINEFIAVCFKFSQKVDKFLFEELLEDFELNVNCRTFLPNLLCTYEKQLKSIRKSDIEKMITQKIVSFEFDDFKSQFIEMSIKKKFEKLTNCQKFDNITKDQFIKAFKKEFSELKEEDFEKLKLNVIEKVTNKSNLNDSNYKIMYSLFDNYMTILRNESLLPNEIDLNDQNNGFYVYYNDDSQESNEAEIDQEEKKKKLLKEIFPHKEDVEIIRFLHSSSTLQEIVRSILIDLNDDDENQFKKFSRNEKISLIKKVFPDKDKYIILNSFEKNGGKVYQTMKSIFDIESSSLNLRFLKNKEPKAISNLKINFPQIEEKMIYKHYYEINNQDYINTIKSLCAEIQKQEIKKMREEEEEKGKKQYYSYFKNFVSNRKNPIETVFVPRHLILYGGSDKRTLTFLIRRYINMLNPTFNFKITLKIQNNKQRPQDDIHWAEIKQILDKLKVNYEPFESNVVVYIYRNTNNHG